MSAIADSAILATAAATCPGMLLFTAPVGGANVVGFGFTNKAKMAITVNIYKNGVTGTPLVTKSIAALGTDTAGWTGHLGAGETLYAVSNIGGFVDVEVDGVSVDTTLSTNQLLQAQNLMISEAFDVDIPDASDLDDAAYTFDA